jgi:peptide/nickel transport system substrate-binding protein
MFTRSIRRSKGSAALLGVLTALVIGALGPSSADAHHLTGHNLVVDTAMVIKTMDPAQVQEPTGAIILHQVYDTLVTFHGTNTTTPAPDLASSYQVLNNARKFVFRLRPGVKFSDGTPLTSTDVLYSLERLKNLAAPNSFVMSGMNIHAPNPSTVVFTSATPNPGFPASLTFEATAIMNSAVLKANGSDDSLNAPQKDTVVSYLNTHSIGTGPYTLTSIDPSSQVVLTANPQYWSKQPYFTRVVLQNVPPVQQKLDVSSGAAQLATDINGNLLNGLPSSLIVRGSLPNRIFCLELSVDPAVSSITTNPHFRNAVRYALDYRSLVKIAGYPSQPLAGMIPTSSPGALPLSESVKTDLVKAKQELALSGAQNPALTLNYISIQFQGFSFDNIAQKMQSDLAQVGINVTLQPMTAPAFITAHNAGKFAMDFFPQKALYADPSTWLVFAPGGSLALRIGYTAETATQAVNAASQAAAQETDASKRLASFQAWGKTMMDSNPPYVPLFTTSNVWVGQSNLTGLHPATTGWAVDFADLAEK